MKLAFVIAAALAGTAVALAARAADDAADKLGPVVVTKTRMPGGPDGAAALSQIQRYDRGSIGLNSMLSLNPSLGGMRPSGHGELLRIPFEPLIAIKDNIDVGGMVTTAGSLALKDNVAVKDASLVARLRAAGGVVAGKANLSEWANFRSPHSLSGWSAVGGMTRNPYALDRTACGSSAGSAVAVAAGFVDVAIGTETDGSIVCPSAMTGVVGMKPTVGLVSRTGVVPISSSQDTPGPIAQNVFWAARALTVMAGSDVADPATIEADQRKTDYWAALTTHTLKGARLGVLTYATGYSPATDAAFARAVAVLEAQGATVVPITNFKPDPRIGADEDLILKVEFKAGIAAYLKAAPPAVKVRNLADLIAFNAATPRETALFGQETFIETQAAPGLDDPNYLKAKAEAKRLAGPEGIDRLLKTYKLDALIAPTTSPAWRLDSIVGDNFQRSVSGLPAVAGYPHLTVPMGLASGMPVGISFIGTAWSEAKLLALGYAYEEASKARVEPGFKATLDEGLAAFAPTP